MSLKLFHFPFACSMAARIAAAEGNVDIDLVYVDGENNLSSGGSLLDLNPLGQVAVLTTDEGEVITETGVVTAYIQAQSTVPEFNIPHYDPRYFQMLRWISFCATEIHKQIFRTVFYPEATTEVKDRIRAMAPKRFEVLSNQLSKTEYLTGNLFSAADAYLTWCLTLASRAGIQTEDFEPLAAYQERVFSRPVVAALIAEDQAKSEAS